MKLFRPTIPLVSIRFWLGFEVWVRVNLAIQIRLALGENTHGPWLGLVIRRIEDSLLMLLELEGLIHIRNLWNIDIESVPLLSVFEILGMRVVKHVFLVDQLGPWQDLVRIRKHGQLFTQHLLLNQQLDFFVLGILLISTLSNGGDFRLFWFLRCCAIWK